MQLETLYKRSKTGSIIQYVIFVTQIDDVPHIIKETGQLGGVQTPYREAVPAGKQKRTALQQAEAQALSDWKRKHDEGYKTLPDILPEGVKWEEGSNIKVMLDKYLPQFNTDASGELLPMLAKSDLWKPSPRNVYPAQIEYKFDGNRTTFVLTEKDTYALSRTGKPQKNLDHLIAILNEASPIEKRTHTIILDGEVYLHGLLLEEINEAIKKANHNTPKLKFMVYDVPLTEGPQSKRTRFASQMVFGISSSFFLFIEPKTVFSDAEVETFHDKAVELGYEGAMVKNLEAEYKPGQRSSDWKKVKVFEDTEFEVINYVFGQRGAQDLKFICKTADGKAFEATMNGTVAQKEKMAANIDSYIGKMLTVQHKGYTKYGIPNLNKGKLFRDE